MTISEELDLVYKEAEALGIDMKDMGFSEDDDVIMFALSYFRVNLADIRELILDTPVDWVDNGY